jgi:trimeric autotransporter adhesin
VNYKWTSPNGFSSSSATATVTHGGLYTLTATNPVNGCTSNKSTTVNENTTPPSITIGNNSPISCANPVVTLSVVTNATNASYLWLGDDFISDSAVVHTTTAGLYILTVTDQISGCSNQELVEVTEDYSDCGARKVTTVPSNASAQESIQEVTVNNFTYKAYPNPVMTNGVIEFTSPQSATATVSIYNALGTCEKVLFKGTVMANRANRVPVPATQLAAGAYYYIINSGGKSFTGKLVIVK